MEGVPPAQNEGFLGHVEVQRLQRLVGEQLPEPAPVDKNEGRLLGFFCEDEGPLEIPPRTSALRLSLVYWT